MIKSFTTLMAFSQGHPGKMIRKTLADHWDNDHEIAFEKIRLRGSLVGWWLLSPPNSVPLRLLGSYLREGRVNDPPKVELSDPSLRDVSWVNSR